MYRWLIQNRAFGPTLRNIEAGHGIPWRTKVLAISMLWVSLLGSIWYVEATSLRLMLAGIGMAITVYLLLLKSAPPPTDSGHSQ